MTQGLDIVGEFAPPTRSEIAAIRAVAGAVPGTRIGVRDGLGEHGIPAEVRVRWLEACLPDVVVETAPSGTPLRLPVGVDPREGPRVLADVFAHWDALPDPVRPDWLVRVAIVGPESVGKSTLAAHLAEHTGGRDVQEFARDAFPWGDPDYRALPEHMVAICDGHRRWLDEAAATADRWLFSDTEALSTLAWSELYFGQVPEGVHDYVEAQAFDVYLLLDADVPWVADGTRTWADHRRPLHRRLRELLLQHDLPFREISGSWTQRFDRALAILDELGAPRRPRGLPGRFPDFVRRDPGTESDAVG